MTKIYSYFDVPRDDGSVNVRDVVFTKPSMTQQQFKDEADINNILERYRATGVLNQVQGFQFGDFSDTPSYQEILNRVMDAQDRFDSLPSNIRRHFDNDPAQFMSFVENPSEENFKLGESLGLWSIKRQHEPEPSPHEGGGGDSEPVS